MKKFLLCFFLLCFIICHSQKKTLDSLLTLTKDSLSLTNIANIYNKIGTIYLNNGEYDKSTQYYFKALNHYEKNNDQKSIANTYVNIGNVLEYNYQEDKAIIYFRKALSVFESFQDKTSIGYCKAQIANCYIDFNKLDTALIYFFEAYKIFDDANDKLNLAKIADGIGSVYHETSDFKKALFYMRQSLQIKIELNNLEGITRELNNIGNDFLKQGLHDSAIFYFNKSLVLANKLNYAPISEILYKNLSRAFAGKGDYKKSLEYYKVYAAFKDSIFTRDRTNAIVEMEAKYQSEKKEKENLILSNSNRMQKFALIGSGLLFVIIILFSWLIFRQNKFRNLQRELLLEQKLLRLQMNPHFIFNSLIAIESFIHTKQPDEAREYLSDFAKLMRLILENSREETVSLRKEIDTLNYYLRLQKLTLEDTFTYKVTLSENIDTEEIQLPPMLIQPFIENAIKHGVNNIANGHIEIVITKENENLIIEIKDNGKGIFESETKSSHNSLATTITQERLLNINLRKKQKINFKISSLASKGTQVIFTIPIV